MAVAQLMSEAAYLGFVQSGVEGSWELHDGRLVEKPGMSWDHLDAITELIAHLHQQLDRADYRVFTESRVRRPAATIFLPDVAVVPTRYGDEFRGRPGALAVFSELLPLVVEVWSASTGDYDVDTKIPVYMQRGDVEIWRIHPYERTLIRNADEHRASATTDPHPPTPPLPVRRGEGGDGRRAGTPNASSAIRMTRWVRQPDASYRETVHHDGTITPVALPGVSIDIGRLFAG